MPPDQRHQEIRDALLTAARGRVPRVTTPRSARYVNDVVATRQWHRTVQAIRREITGPDAATARRREHAYGLFVDELLAATPVEARVPSAVSAVAMTDARAGGDHRTLDHLALALYEASLDLTLAPAPLLHERLQRLAQLNGTTQTDGGRPQGGWRGVRSGPFRQIDEVLPTELADLDLFASKVARDEVQRYRRFSPNEEEPYVLITVDLDGRRLNASSHPTRGYLISWAKAFTLWFLHDVARHVARRSPIPFRARVGGPGIVPCTVNLHDVPNDEVEENRPFLESMRELGPFLTRRLDAPALGQPNPVLGSAPLLTYHLSVGPEASADLGGPSPTRAVVRLSGSRLRLETHTLAAPRESPYPDSPDAHREDTGLGDLRRSLLDALVSRCVSTLIRR